VLVLLNVYPLVISRESVFSAKEASLSAQTTVICSSLESLDSLSRESVLRTMSQTDIRGLSRVLVADSVGTVLYEFSSGSGAEHENRLSWGLDYALSGYDVFHSGFSDGAFYSTAASPIYGGGKLAGAVYIYEYDRTEGSVIVSLQNSLETISIAVCVMAVIMSFVFSSTITHRITELLGAIEKVREGDYKQRVKTRGSDELARLGEAFNGMSARLHDTEEMRRRFVSDASHELKTPLASIRLLSDSILQNSEMDSEMVHEFVDDIGNEAERLARTTEKLLNLTRLDNRIVPERTYVNLAEVVRSALRILKPVADNSGIALNSALRSDCFVFATEDDMYQIVLNLAENAVKYNVPDGSVFVNLTRDDSQVTLTVEDTGIGIPEADMPYIFDRFYRVDKARSRASGGSGLGLSIVKATVEEHGGSITAEHVRGGGTRFIAVFPLKTPPSSADIGNG